MKENKHQAVEGEEQWEYGSEYDDEQENGNPDDNQEYDSAQY